jgi:hypothetical protein
MDANENCSDTKSEDGKNAVRKLQKTDLRA